MKYALLIALSVTFSVSARGSATSEQLEAFKSSIKQGCIARGIERQDDHAVAFCSCMDKVLRSALSDAEFAGAYTGANRTSIPALSGHPFRFNPDTDSGINQPVFV